MKYAGTFTDWQGQQYQVNSLAELQQYNDYLTQAIVDGKLTPSQYETEFNKAIITTTHQYDVDRTAGGRLIRIYIRPVPDYSQSWLQRIVVQRG